VPIGPTEDFLNPPPAFPETSNMTENTDLFGTAPDSQEMNWKDPLMGQDDVAPQVSLIGSSSNNQNNCSSGYIS